MSVLTRRALGALILTLPATAFAHHDVTAGDIAIGHPWTRAAGANANGAGFMTLKNNGATPDRLVSAASPAARVVELDREPHPLRVPSGAPHVPSANLRSCSAASSYCSVRIALIICAMRVNGTAARAP